MLYDGRCPPCSREVAVLRRRNGRGLVAFEDIAAAAFDPGRYGLTAAQAVGTMHVVRPDGSVVRGADVFADGYDAVGWARLARPLRWRPTRPLAVLAYRLFAAVRPRLSRHRSAQDGCVGGSCKTGGPHQPAVGPPPNA